MNTHTTSTSSTSTTSTSTSDTLSTANTPTISTASTSEDDRMNDLRRRILAINSDLTLSPRDKSLRIQMLLTPKSLMNSFISNEEAIDPEKEPTYHDKEQGVLGCPHYQRGCKLRAACCGRCFTCRFCHDEKSDHMINRFDTREVMCMYCETIQPVSNKCSNCKKVFGRYFCSDCKFIDDDPKKAIFHCPHCGICRIGNGLEIDFRHCMKCNGCLSTKNYDQHKCIDNKLGSNCPICQYSLDSGGTVVMMACGHGIHEPCLSEYAESNYKCPLCAKSIFPSAHMTTWWELFDHEIRVQPMPAEFRKHVTYMLCNDCEARTYTPFHFVGNKCGECGGYCTSIIRREEVDVKDHGSLPLATNHTVRYNDDPSVLEQLSREG